MPISLRNHLFVGTIALVILIGMSVESIQRYASILSTQKEERVVNIGIEHTLPLSLRFEFSVKGENAMLQLTHDDGNEDVIVNLPTMWERREVRGVAVDQLTSEESLFGFTRWHFPAGSSIQYWIPELPTEIIAHNPSGVQLKLTVLTFDVGTEKLNEDIFLVLDEPVIMY